MNEGQWRQWKGFGLNVKGGLNVIVRWRVAIIMASDNPSISVADQIIQGNSEKFKDFFNLNC